jgi:hypothetical protein
MSLFHMTWKSTAAASGAMVVATWLASHAPVGGPRQAPAAVPSHANTESAAAEIQREADRLHLRLNRVASYRLPSRNLFRFSDRPVPHAIPRPPVTPATEIPPAPQPEAPAMRLTLTGIAEDVVGDQVTRSAIISAPDDVHIVKVGDTIADTYTVTRIDGEAVELSRLQDGSRLQLSLRR